MNDYPEWELIDSKRVVDSDGYNTDYTLWYDSANDRWGCVFGDYELYDPYNADLDAEFTEEWEAREWFEDYQGFAEDYDDDWRDEV